LADNIIGKITRSGQQ